MDAVRELLEENEQLETLLGAAQERIGDLERELRAWRNGARSSAAENVKQRLAGLPGG